MNVAVLQHAALATILLSGRLSASDSLTNTLAVMHNQFAAVSRSISSRSILQVSAQSSLRVIRAPLVCSKNAPAADDVQGRYAGRSTPKQPCGTVRRVSAAAVALIGCERRQAAGSYAVQ